MRNGEYLQTAFQGKKDKIVRKSLNSNAARAAPMLVGNHRVGADTAYCELY